MKCPPVKDIVEAVEAQKAPPTLADHMQSCDACHSVHAALHEEAEGLSISIGALWIKERISCPHEDILHAFIDGSLGAEEHRYIEFHTNDVGCPYCQSAIAEFGEESKGGTTDEIRSAMENSLRSSTSFLDSIDRG